MRLADVIVCTAVHDGGPGIEKPELIGWLLARLAADGHIPTTALREIRHAVLERERLGSTGIGGGVAIPHAKHAAVPRSVGVLAKCRAAVAFDAIDGELVDIIALCLFPTNSVVNQLVQMARKTGEMLRRLPDESFCGRLRCADSAEELFDLVKREGGMTRREWETCQDPDPMLRFLLGLRADELRVQDVEAFPYCLTSDRKLRLFACACYHRVRHLLPDVQARTAAEVAERFADGDPDADDELRRTRFGLRTTLDALEPTWRAAGGAARTALMPRHDALALAFQVCLRLAPKSAYYAASNASYAFAAIHEIRYNSASIAESRAQTDLLRCIFGPTPAEPPRFDERWRTPDVLAIARRVYDERDFAALPVLADALTDSGCDDADVFAHLRGPGPHVRGCWVLDLVLSKE